METAESGINFRDLLSNYWHSRGLIMIGVIFALYCPFSMFLVPMAILMDFIYQNPTLPLNEGIRPQETVLNSFLWVKEQYRRLFQKHKQKKAE